MVAKTSSMITSLPHQVFKIKLQIINVSLSRTKKMIMKRKTMRVMKKERLSRTLVYILKYQTRDDKALPKTILRSKSLKML